jgi:hypothetical protein
MLNHIYKVDPSTSPEKAQQLAEIWDEVVSSIIKGMLDIANPQMGDLHINLREEMALEMAKLIVFISEKVASDRTSGRAINEIDHHLERDQCFSLEGKERISNTAKNCASQIWLRKYNERWKPKTEAALRKEKNPKKKLLHLRQLKTTILSQSPSSKNTGRKVKLSTETSRHQKALRKKRELLWAAGVLEKTYTLTA